MQKIKTLNELTHLKESRFGRPHPRHGLKLLYWFANDCVSFRQYSMISECDPECEDFGFHPFENRYDRNGVRLLPDVGVLYYVVGNLNSPGAEELPDYVREDYTGLLDDSNMDRIIVGFDNEMIDRVYVTEHDDRTQYNPDATYRISKGLLKTIRTLKLENFLRQAGHYQHSDPAFQMVLISVDPKPINTASVSQVSPPRNQDYRVRMDPDSGRDVNGGTTTGYSSGTQRNTCCECIIL